jgi:hypothetical protein
VLGYLTSAQSVELTRFGGRGEAFGFTPSTHLLYMGSPKHTSIDGDQPLVILNWGI